MSDLSGRPTGSAQCLDEIGLAESKLKPAVRANCPKRLPVEPRSPGQVEIIGDRFRSKEYFATWRNDPMQTLQQS